MGSGGLNIKDLTGQTFAKLTVIGRAQREGHTGAFWLCKCECGNETIVLGTYLRKNMTKSCGCRRKEVGFKAGEVAHAMTDQEAFDKYTPNRPEIGCWTWAGATIKDEYGKPTYGRVFCRERAMRAHRLSYRLHYGEISDDLLIRHLCNNPICVRPDHLALGTHKDNLDDRRKAEGKLTSRSHVLTKDQVREIRRMFDSKLYTQNQIACKFGISRDTVSAVGTRKTHKDVPD